MYHKFFGLKESPFNINPDPRYLFMTRHTQEALACLIYGIQARKGFVVLTGEVGTGKTTVLNKMLEWARHENVATAFIFNPRLSEMEFLDFMMADFAIPGESQMKSRVLINLNHWLLERHQQGQRAVLVVDEAQNLSVEMLEEIRLLTNLETSSEKLLQIVLAGQPEFDRKLDAPNLRQLKQRIVLRYSLQPFTLRDAVEYMQSRLEKAGMPNQTVFPEELMAEIHLRTQGIPRVINAICDNLLLTAFALEQKVCTAEMLDEVCRDIRLEWPGSRRARSRIDDESYERTRF